jgi:hypothetical protein
MAGYSTALQISRSTTIRSIHWASMMRPLETSNQETPDKSQSNEQNRAANHGLSLFGKCETNEAHRQTSAE